MIVQDLSEAPKESVKNSFMETEQLYTVPAEYL